MNTITLTLCASTRTGCLSAPIHSCADERLTLAGDLTLSAGTSVALITPRGDTLAHTILSEECAPGATIPLSTLTAQAAEYTRSCRAGDTREALLAIGDSEHPLALIPARIAQNPLYTLAPPADLAPAYPTTETLKSLLAEMQAASNSAAQSATDARKSAEEAGESASSAASDRATAVYAATSAQAYAEVATAAQARASTYAAEASTSAANAASSATSARDDASSAISAANSAAGSASKAAASADSAAFALTASTNAANRAEVAAEKAREADISASSSASAASQSATAAAQEAAENVATLLQGKVDAAEAAKAGAEAAKTAAETAKAVADAAKAAAASSATAAANSASAAAKSATDLADAVATAESLDGRIDALEGGTGAYIIQSRDVISHGTPTPADVGKVLYFDHFAGETTSTLAVTNSTPWAQKVCPAPIVANGAELCAVGCFDYTKNKKYIVFMTAILVNPIGYLYELNVGTNSSTLTFKSKLATSYFSDATVGASYWCRNICVHDGFVFYTRRHSYDGPALTICEVDTGKLITNIDLDPKDTGGRYVNSAIWYNPLSGHICVLSYAFSLSTGETWGGKSETYNNTHFVRVFSWDSETKTLSDIPDGDSPATVIDVTDAFTEAGATGVRNDRAYGSTWPIRDQVFVSIQGSSYMALFHATADDRIEPCYEWDVEYATGEDGITRPVWETQPEEWTDADGNTQTIQNYVLNNLYDHVIRPKMTKGRLLKFCCAAGYDGVPSGTWSANPVFHHPTYSFCVSGENQMLPEPHWYYGGFNSLIALTDGVVQWAPIAGYKFVRLEAFNRWDHVVVDNRTDRPEFFRRADDGRWLLNDIRKGSARKFSGWLPKSGQYMSSVGATQTAKSFGDIAVLTPLTAAQSGTPLSRIGMVSNAGTDSAAMTPLPTTATYDIKWWIASMLPYCAWGFFGNVWMTDYNKTIGGVL